MTSIDRLAETLSHTHSVEISNEGWQQQGWIERFFLWATRRQGTVWVKNLKEINRAFEEMERNGGQRKEEWLPAAVKVLEVTDRMGQSTQLPIVSLASRTWHWITGVNQLQKERVELERRVIGLKYRMGDSNQEDLPIDEKLLEMAQEWKNNPRFYREKIRELSAFDLSLLTNASRYPEFIDFMSRRPAVQQAFFKWTIRDHNSAESFIEFPAMQQWIHQSYLSSAVGYAAEYGFECLKVSGEEGNRDLTLPFVLEDGTSQDISILNNDAAVTFDRGLVMTIEEVFQVFANKNIEQGHLTFWACDGGIRNYHSRYWGPWDPKEGKYIEANLEDPNWFQSVPAPLKLTVDQAKDFFAEAQKIGDGYTIQPDEIDGNNVIVTLRASRASADLNIADSHGWIQFAIPNNEGGYNVHDFGKYAEHFPVSVIEYLLILTEPVRAVWTNRDENIDYNYRERASLSVAVDPEHLEFIIDLNKQMIEIARAGKSTFHLQKSGCFKAAVEMFVIILQRTGRGKEGKEIRKFLNTSGVECVAQPPVGWTPKIAHVIATVLHKPDDWAMYHIYRSWGGWRKRKHTKLKYNPETKQLEKKTIVAQMTQNKEIKFHFAHPAKLVEFINLVRRILYPEAV